MTFGDLINLYENKKKIYGDNTYRYISEILKEAKESYIRFKLENGVDDAEQSWKAFKGKNLEKII